MQTILIEDYKVRVISNINLNNGFLSEVFYLDSKDGAYHWANASHFNDTNDTEVRPINDQENKNDNGTQLPVPKYSWW